MGPFFFFFGLVKSFRLLFLLLMTKHWNLPPNSKLLLTLFHILGTYKAIVPYASQPACEIFWLSQFLIKLYHTFLDIWQYAWMVINTHNLLLHFLVIFAMRLFTDFCCFEFCDYEKVPTQYAHVNCGNCRTTLMYPYGAPSVKCAVCHYVTNVGVSMIDLIFIK